jgi:hypothetical protein
MYKLCTNLVVIYFLTYLPIYNETYYFLHNLVTKVKPYY